MLVLMLNLNWQVWCICWGWYCGLDDEEEVEVDGGDEDNGGRDGRGNDWGGDGEGVLLFIGVGK